MSSNRQPRNTRAEARPVAVLVAAALLLAACVASAADAEAGDWKTCPPKYEGSPTILAHAVGCGKAEAVVDDVYVKAQTDAPTHKLKVDGYTCHLAATAGTPSGPRRPITCRRGPKVIKAPLPG